MINSSQLWTLVCFALLQTKTLANALGSPQLRLEGRFYPGTDTGDSAELPQTFSWPGSTVATRFQGATSVTVILQALPQNSRLTYGINWSCRFRISVDGQLFTDGFTSYNQPNLTVRLTTTPAAHTLQVAKLIEGGKGEAVLQNITLEGGRFVPLNFVPTDKRILILGDSYTTGYGNAGGNGSLACFPAASQLTANMTATCKSLQVWDADECANYWGSLNENNLKAYGPVAANALQADLQMLAEAGSGLIGYAYAEQQYPGLPESSYRIFQPANDLLFNRSLYSDPQSHYDLTSWMPQVVVIASGSNDWNAYSYKYTLQQWTTAAANFLESISDTFEDPDIIILLFPKGLANVNGSTGGFQSNPDYLKGMQSLYDETQRRNLTNVDLLRLDAPSDSVLPNWCNHHPTAAAHAEIAAQLAARIVALRPSWGPVGAIDGFPSDMDLQPAPLTASRLGGSPASSTGMAPSAALNTLFSGPISGPPTSSLARSPVVSVG